MKELSPQLVLGHGLFFQKTLLSASRFVDYCKKRDIDISEERLEKFEELGVFLPMLRISYPEIITKIRTYQTEDNLSKIEDLGRLEEDETWDGEIRKDYAAFIYWDKDYVDSWIDEGWVFIPNKANFQSWSSYKDERGWTKVESYYSIFQTLPLHMLIQELTLNQRIEELAFRSEEEAIKSYRNSITFFRGMIDRLSERESAFDKYAKICQIISTRYFPEAESDGLTISVPDREITNFDFFEYRRNWSAKDFLKELELSEDEVARAWESVSYDVKSINPIADWKDLVNFVTKSKRERLKGRALLAETWKLMVKMLNMFYENLTERKLYIYGESPETIEVFRGKGITKDDLRFNEFVANEFGVNPRPKLILMVEGDGEFYEIPKLAKLAFGKSFAAYKIQIINLKSIGEFNSRKIERFIDHFHDLQTLVYFILDNENNSQQTKQRIVNKPSQYIENLTITKDDFFTIWNRNIEFDNFTDKEIAQAMTNLCENRYIFTEIEIINCRRDFGSRRDTLSDLYKEKLNYSLDKPKLLEILFSYIESNYKIIIEDTEINRPILDAIDKVTYLAMRNYQPTNLNAWTENQNSGWLRNVINS